MNTVSYVGFEVDYVIVDDNWRFYRCIKLAVKGSQKGCAGYYFNCIPVIRYRLMIYVSVSRSVAEPDSVICWELKL